LSDDPLLRQPDEVVRRSFMEGLRLMFPDFDVNDLVSVHVNRAIKVQPLQVLNYSSIAPVVRTRNPDFYVLNTSQFVNNTLNNNEVIRAVDEFMDEFAPTFDQPGHASVPVQLSACLH
jgi:hypothetical protein